DDKTGMARRLFDQFLAPQKAPAYFDDKDLNEAAEKHDHIHAFCRGALGAPVWGFAPAAGQTCIHQALEAANWDIDKMKPADKLDPPAFNDGSKKLRTGDFNNGLGLMINGVQHAYAVATHYH